MLYADGAAPWERPLWCGRASVRSAGAGELEIEAEILAPFRVHVDELEHWAGGESVSVPGGGRMIFFASPGAAARHRRNWKAHWERSLRSMEHELERILAASSPGRSG